MNLRLVAIASAAAAAIVALAAGGFAYWRTIVAPVPETPCPATTRAEIEARGAAFAGSFFTSQYTVNGMIVRSVEGEPDPACTFFLSAMRCTAPGPATVGARLHNAEAYFDIPEGRSATILVTDSGIACGLEG